MPSSSRRTVPLPAGWGRVAFAVLARDPQCRYGQCGLEDEPVMICGQPSTQVDHIGQAWDHRPEMLRGICEPHHLKRSSAQGNAARARQRSLRYRPPERHPAYRYSPSASKEGSP